MSEDQCTWPEQDWVEAWAREQGVELTNKQRLALAQRMTEPRVQTVSKGGPRVDDHALYYHRSEDAVLLEVDLDSKWCEISWTEQDDQGAPAIGISLTERSKGCGSTNPELEDRSTVISFPEYPAWDLFTYGLSRYTLRACLVRQSEPLLHEEDQDG